MAQQTLEGIQVLDFSTYIAGPYGASLLGDMGADVVKVETPEGDPMRHYPSTLPGESRAFLGVNRNKRGIVLDLKQPADRAACHRLVADADVVLHNFRPGVAERLGLDFDTLCALQPRLVYCSFTGYGPDGPQAQRPGFDQVLQCRTGIAQAQGYPGDEPRVVWGSAVDFYGASLIATGICAALFQRERTRLAQRVDTSLLQAALAMQAGRMVWAEGESAEVDRDLRGGALSGLHPTRDGYLYLQAQTEAFWQALCELTGLGHLACDSRYAHMRLRKANEAVLLPQLRAALMTRSAREWEAIFGTRVPCTVVRGIEAVFDDEQVAHQGLLVTHAHPTLGSYRAVAEPIRFNGERSGKQERRAPMLGEHTADIVGPAR
ncbi:CaiB/BaiF CoA-transferase family protein [Variovorax sp. UMC13]|uniref:CaiB/BaiF CoA transferase family protein n=1 Tax=Variovorax sp. UMC13 TaxID=1862326 RepID=UPI00160006D8|nr:CoA transferase [Variovorax sp. UMC13]MBB1601815.1 formyl-CoA transferase [Variovorax sp. UMC13]